MKRKILTILLFVLVSTAFYLQSQNGWSLGVKARLNISSAGGDFSDANSRLGYNAGIIADYNFSESIFFRTGLDFTSKGAKYKDAWNNIASDGTTGYQKRYYHLNYLQLPLSLGYRIAATENINMTVSAGAYLAYGVYAREKYTAHSWCGTPPTTPDVTITSKGFDDSGMRAFDSGLLGGVGLEYKQYMLLIGYEMGLYNTMSGKYDGGDPSWKNRNWSFSLGYRF